MLPRRHFIKTSADLLRHHRLAVASRAKGSEHAMPPCEGLPDSADPGDIYVWLLHVAEATSHALNQTQKDGLSVEV